MLDRLTELINNNSIPVYDIAVYENETVTQKTITPAHLCNNIYSTSKSYTAIALGMLYDRKLVSLDDNIYDILKGQYSDIPEMWKEVTIKILLSQTTGLDGMFLDIDSDDIYSYPSLDFMKLTLEKPFVYRPGKCFGYSDSNFYLASRVFSTLSGEKMQDYLGRELFIPLRYIGWTWACCPEGHAMGGTGLYISCRDMLNFGIMLLNDGVFKGKRIVSSEWIKLATSKTIALSNDDYYCLGFRRKAYGQAYFCSGAFGQIIYIDPERKLVAAWQAHDTAGKVGKLIDLLEADKTNGK